MKQELTQDERLPSIVEIEKRLNLRKRVEFLGKVIEEFNALIEDLKVLSKAYERILSNETDLPQDFSLQKISENLIH
ncbi:hypothetical protein ACRQ5D_14635 [Mucilaginibacter sp. P25]|uniref:hypothetical protein n=1 Tax=Mucilaginibacter sp. P25 TaxID=3423945 RepID=UPI003D7953A6